jgi:hypothetical protein
VRAENGVCWLTDHTGIVTHPATRKPPRPLLTSRETLEPRRAATPKKSVLGVPGGLGVYNAFQTRSAQCAQRNGVCWLTDHTGIVTHPATRKPPRPLLTSCETLAAASVVVRLCTRPRGSVPTCTFIP